MGWLRSHSRLAGVLGVCVLAVVGVVVAATVAPAGGRGTSAIQTTGDYAPISVQRPRLHILAGSLVSDPEAGIQNNLTTALSQLPGSNRYRITVTNTSNIGFIDAFQWYPPTGIHIVKVLGSSAGRCELSGLTGFGGSQFQTVLLYPNISCEKVGLKPPTCTCQGDGGSVDVSFASDKPMSATGTSRMISARLVLHPIPSYEQPASVPSNVPLGAGG
jgi:hypothetical protein